MGHLAVLCVGSRDQSMTVVHILVSSSHVACLLTPAWQSYRAVCVPFLQMRMAKQMPWPCQELVRRLLFAVARAGSAVGSACQAASATPDGREFWPGFVDLGSCSFWNWLVWDFQFSLEWETLSLSKASLRVLREPAGSSLHWHFCSWSYWFIINVAKASALGSSRKLFSSASRETWAVERTRDVFESFC